VPAPLAGIGVDASRSSDLAKRASDAAIEKSATASTDISTAGFDLIPNVGPVRAVAIRALHNALGTSFQPLMTLCTGATIG
jgi:hypothetical protein